MEIELAEYERLKRIETNNPKLCEGVNCQYQQEHNQKKWSWTHFFIGIIKQFQRVEFWIFIVTTAMFIKYAPKNILGFWIAYICLGVAFMFFTPLSHLLSNGKLNVEAKVGASVNKNING